jgi:rSAM/selenodomain-associated transferase 1
MSVAREGTLCVFAKPPRPGLAKTRLAPRVGSAGAALLAHAFLRDTWQAARALRWARAVLATTAGPIEGLGRATVWPQGGGDLGARMERVMRRALRAGGFALAVGADSPGLPPSRLEDARRRLRDFDAVLGPSEDGGFYLIGLNRCPRGLLAGLPWSRSDTCKRTLALLKAKGLKLAVLDAWFDVDLPADLDRLCALAAHGELNAPATVEALHALGLTAPTRGARARPSPNQSRAGACPPPAHSHPETAFRPVTCNRMNETATPFMPSPSRRDSPSTSLRYAHDDRSSRPLK